MNTRRSFLGFFVTLLSVVLLIGQTFASSVSELNSGAVIEERFLASLRLEPILSSDGKAVYNAVPLKVVVADPNPSSIQIRVPAPLDLAQASESATASFSITYIPAGGKDIRGETCYAFPENAKAAFNAAANVWANLVRSSVPIAIRACWASLASASTLGYSGGGTIHRDFSNAPRADTWYSQSLANSLAGYNLDPSNVDMHITYNLKFNWYFGTDGNTPSNQYDFMSVVLHEICHGLNFSGSMQYSGGWAGWGYYGSPNIYDTFIKDGTGNFIVNTGVYPNPSTALGSAVTSNNLWFYGSNAMTANGGNAVKIYAPSTWTSGSSYSHLDYNTFAGTVNRLMVWAISNGDSIHDPGPVTLGLLDDLGWCSPPPAATLVSPSGTSSTNAPSYVWSAVSQATSYYLWVNDSTGNKIKQWYTASEAGCGGGTGNCSVWVGTPLATGSAQWYIQTANACGNGPWSSALSFNVAPVDLPGKISLVFPSGTIASNSPTYIWNALPNVTWYYLWVVDSSGKNVQIWYRPADVGCAAGTGTCSVTPGIALAAGAAKWWVEGYNSSGLGPWSDANNFTVVLIPPASTLIAPAGTITTNAPNYSWQAVYGSTWYYLWVNDTTGNKIKQWYTAAQAGCASGTGTCSVWAGTMLASGSAQWWIETYNANGYGPWSSSLNFSVAPADLPGNPTLVSPSGNISTATPTYTWNALSNATWYYLWVNDSTGEKVKQWYSTDDAGCAGGTGTCSVTPTAVLAQGSAKWWVQGYNSSGFGPWSSPMPFSVTLSSGLND
jgi:hypothetical protein